MKTFILSSLLSGIFLTGTILYFGSVDRSTANVENHTYDNALHNSQKEQSLSCLSNVHLSLGSEGYGVLEPQLLLSGTFQDYSRFEVTIVNPPVNTDTANCSMVGSTIMVEVYDTQQDIKCWSNVLVEDKLSPTTDCSTVDVPCNLDPYAKNIDLFLPDLADNCTDTSDLTITFNQTQSGTGCGSPYVLLVDRTWFITDEYGNTTTCDQLIRFVRPNMDSIIFPMDTTLYCPDNDTDPSNTGVPTLFGEPVSMQCGLMVWNEDNVIGKCGETVKVMRSWFVMDWCRNIQRSDLQIIQVNDTTPPMVDCPLDDTIYTADAECFGLYDIPPFNVQDDCTSPGDFDFDYYVNGVFTNQTQNIPLDRGVNEIRIIIRDACNNAAECLYEVTVIDNETPTVVCYDDILGLPSTGDITIGADFFQSIQYMDNCEIVDTMIRRVNSDCGNPNDRIFGEEITICCEDVGDTIMIEVKGTDAAGNMNSCMFMLEIQDNLPPMVSCPNDTTVNCDDLTGDYSVFGSPFITDNCSFTVDSSVTVDLDDCKRGRILRKWVATDEFGNVDSCTQVITVENPYEFDPASITWPADITVSACVPGGLDPDSLGSRPDFMQTPCNTVGSTYTDMTQSLDSACVFIMRTWTITDSCENTDTSYVQMIRQINSAPPVLSIPADTTLYADAICLGEATLPSASTNDCSSGVTFENSYSGQGAQLDTVFPLGQTQIIFTATDDCNNVSRDTMVVTVEDTTSPTIVCLPDTTFYTEMDICSAIVELPIPETDDNCRVISVVNDYNNTEDASDTYPLGTTTVTYTVTDTSLNITTCSFTILVVDTVSPELICPPGPYTLYLDSLCNVTIPDFRDSVSVTDNCSSPMNITLTQTPMDMTMLMGVQDTTIQIIATDEAGNMDTCEIPISLIDTLPPDIVCPDNDTLYLDGNCEAVIGDYTDSAMVMSNCTQMMNILITQSPDPGTIASGANNVIIITLTAEDSSMNTMSCTFTVTLLDTTPPVFDSPAPADTTVECDEVPVMATLMATDNCGTVTINTKEDTTAGSCPQEYTLRRVWTATDGSGNSDSVEQIVTVIDTSAPVFDSPAPADMTVECDEVPIMATLTATDNCGAVTLNTREDSTAGTCPQEYTLRRVWTAEDECGNVDSVDQIINVIDTTAPVFNINPIDTTVNCDAVIPTPSPIATDNCGSVSLTAASSIIQGDCPNEFIISRSWSATDECGNSATITQTVTIQDTTAPVITCPADITIACTSRADTNVTGTASATDNCETDVAITFSDDTTAGICAGEYVITRTFTADDSCENTATCEQIITVIDTVAPVFDNTAPADTTIACDAIVPVPATLTATDNCSNVTVIQSADTTAGSCPQEFTIRRVWTAEDGCGNADSLEQFISIIDTVAPSFDSLPEADTTIDCDQPIPTPASLTATDNCGTAGVAFFETVTPGSCPQENTTTQIWVANDGCGNTDTVMRVITVQDTFVPVFDNLPPSDTTVSCDDVPPAVTLTASDSCGTATVTFREDTTAGSNPQEYTLRRVWTAEDLCSNIDSVDQIVTVRDTTPPILTCPSDITLTLGANCQLSLPDLTGGASATDNCSQMNSITYEQIPPAGSLITEEGDSTILIVATDISGNSDTCEFIVTVEDRVPPSIVCPENDTVYLDALCSFEIDDFRDSAVVSDNCTDTMNISISQIPDNGTIFNLGGDTTIIVQLIATDLSGNMDTCEFSLIVRDTTPPSISCPDDLTLFADANCQAVVPDLTDSVVLSDNCDGDSTIMATQSPLGGTILTGEQTITITLTATDMNGQTQTCSVSLTVVDTTAPEVICPPDITLEADSTCSVQIPNFVDSALISDNCTDSVDLIITQDPAPGSTVSADAGDTLKVTITVEDESGNVDSCMVFIVVVDSTAPTFLCSGEAQSVTLNENCEGIVPDLRGEVTMLEDNCTGINNINIEQIPDSGTVFTVMGTLDTTVLIIVSDSSGNADTCSIPLTFEDDTPPMLICPPDTLVPCGFTYNTLNDFGVATATDNCSAVNITSSSVIHLNDCELTDSIVRRFIAMDQNGNVDTCYQSIIVDGSVEVLGEEDFNYPDTVMAMDCNFTDPADIPGSIPELDSTLMACNVIGISFADSINPTSSAACIEIFRTFTIIDSCNYDPNTGEGQFEIDQLVLVNDTSAPVLIPPIQDTTIYIDTCGTKRLTLDSVAATDCAGIDTIFNNSPFAFSNSGGDISGDYPFGVHNVNIFAEDSCGNIDSVSIVVTVTDSFPDTLTCNFKDINSLDSTTMQAFFFAGEFFGSYVDSCGNAPLGEITVSFSPTDTSEDVIVITCDSITSDSSNYILDTVLYVYLDGVLVDSCDIELGVDNPELCVMNIISGQVTGIHGHEFRDVGINIYNEYQHKQVVTDQLGIYYADGLMSNQQYSVQPVYEGDPWEGISTFDILLIYRHILGMDMIDNSYYNIAADVDKSGTISGADLIHIKKLILRMTDHLPVDDWRFVCNKHEFSDPISACAEDYREITKVFTEGSVKGVNFKGFKVGDVDGSVDMTARARSAPTFLNVEEQKGHWIFTGTFSDIIYGFQMEVDLGTNHGVQLESGKFDLTHEDYSFTEDGNLIISWTSPHGVSVEEGESLFSIMNYSPENGKPIELVEDKLDAEIYRTGSDEISDIKLRFTDQKEEFALYQNSPNPWTDRTTIPYNLKEDGKLELRILNASGQEVFRRSENGKAGYNELYIRSTDLEGPGVYYYQIVGDGLEASKKMIVVQ